MSLPSPMIGNLTGVKANNSFFFVDRLFFRLMVLNICGGTGILQIDRGRRCPVNYAKNVVCGYRKLA